MNVTLIAGLPGSGKTTLLGELAANGAICIDDICDRSSLPGCRVPWLAVADVNFCRQEVRAAAEVEITRRYGAIDVEWIFFANDPEQCRANASARNDGRDVVADIEVLSRLYVIPEEAKIVPVYGTSPEATLPRY